MPIILVLLLTAACTKVPWPMPPFGLGARGSLFLTAIAFILPISAAILLSRWASATIKHHPERRTDVAIRYTRLRRAFGILTLLIAIVAVAGLGWGWTVWHRATVETHAGPRLAPFAELLVPAPYLLSLFLVWLIHYDAERTLHGNSGESSRQFFSRLRHFLFNLRPFAVIVLLPVLLIAVQQTIGRMFPEFAASAWAQLGSLLSIVVVFIGIPLLLKPALGLQSMPAGPQRARLEAIAARVNLRYADLLLWPTHGAMTNAMVVGIIPQARYVIFTDLLLESLSQHELEAVFGHEVGHVKHSHIPYYAIFFVLSASVMVAIASALMHAADDLGWLPWADGEAWVSLVSMGLLAAYMYSVFGWLSRKCERQADIYGCRVASGTDTLHPDGVSAMIRALERVADLNGFDRTLGSSRWQRFRATMRAWMHGSIADRIAYLRQLAERPTIEQPFQRHIWRTRLGLLLVLVLLLAAFVSWMGWQELLREMA